MAAPIKFGVVKAFAARKDDALIRGRGRYTDDVAPQPALHALVLRSPHAHAKFTINASGPLASGVAAILTAEDVKDLGDLPCLFNLEVDPFTGPPYPILPGRSPHVGDAIAFVVATRRPGRDAIEAIVSKLEAAAGVVALLMPRSATHRGPDDQRCPQRPGGFQQVRARNLILTHEHLRREHDD